MKHKAKRQAAWTTAAAIMALAWPTIAEQVMQTAVQYIDTAMVGSLSTQATAAVGATSTVAWLVGSIFSALGVGDLESARKAVASALSYVWGGIHITWRLWHHPLVSPRGMSLVSAWACMIAHNMLLFCLYLVTFIRGGWNPLNGEHS